MGLVVFLWPPVFFLSWCKDRGTQFVPAFRTADRLPELRGDLPVSATAVIRKVLLRRSGGRLGAVFISCALALLLQAPVFALADPGQMLPSAEDVRLQGERMYREGILPTGRPMEAYVKGDIPVSGAAFTCVSCHLRSGLGSFEGGVFTTPTNGRVLFKPRAEPRSDVTPPPTMMGASSKPLKARPAYTEQTLAAALRGGVDPAGRVLHDVMPRYLLEEADMDIMVSYLKSLSDEFSPGVDGSVLRFATIITDEVPPAEAEAMAGPLEQFVRKMNTQASAVEPPRKRSPRLEYFAKTKKVAYRKLSLSRWLLKGPPGTWRKQLEDYYRREPVFALVGGITTGSWEPIHRFSEEHRVPSLLPVTDLPSSRETDWYTLYFSKGYRLEGETAARFLNASGRSAKDAPLVQIVRDSREGRALAEGFGDTWRDLGHPAPRTVSAAVGEDIRGVLAKTLSGETPAVILLWDGVGVLPALAELTDRPARPVQVFVSGRYLGKELSKIPEEARPFTYITYPFRLPANELLYESAMEPFLKDYGLPGEPPIVTKQAYIVIRVLTQALMDMKDQFYRDYFFDVIGGIKDLESPLYERLSFGPGQRYASKGCYVVQLTNGPGPGLIRSSEWVTH